MTDGTEAIPSTCLCLAEGKEAVEHPFALVFPAQDAFVAWLLEVLKMFALLELQHWAIIPLVFLWVAVSDGCSRRSRANINSKEM